VKQVALAKHLLRTAINLILRAVSWLNVSGLTLDATTLKRCTLVGSLTRPSVLGAESVAGWQITASLIPWVSPVRSWMLPTVFSAPQSASGMQSAVNPAPRGAAKSCALKPVSAVPIVVGWESTVALLS